MITGTENDDRLRGTSGDDVFEGLGGDDTLKGGAGTDTAVFAGSVFDYTWSDSGRDVVINDRRFGDEDTGRDTLEDIELLQFDEVTIDLNSDFQTVFGGEDHHSLTVGEKITVQISFLDYDDRLYLNQTAPSWGQGAFSFQGDASSIDSLGGSYNVYNLTADTSGRYFTDEMRMLAKGEVMSRVWAFEMKVGDAFGDDVFAKDITFDFIGVNDAPTMSGNDTLWVREQGITRSLDLTQFADDIDSDDTGDSLTYEIVRQSKKVDVWIEGSTLFYGPKGINPRTTSDEVLKGFVEVRAVDRHGAASDDILRVDLRATGIDNNPPEVVVGFSGPRYDKLGIDIAAAPNLGLFTSLAFDPDYASYFDFTGGADETVIRSNFVSGFTQGRSIKDAEGVTIVEDAWFDTGYGDDVLVFHLRDDFEVGMGIVDIQTRTGEDVVIIDAKATSTAEGASAILNGVDINTGRHSDQVWLSANADTNNWITGSVRMGAGHDRLFVRIEDDFDGDTGAYAFFDASVDLGSGDDVMDLRIDTSPRGFVANIEGYIDAGRGDDIVRLINSGTVFREIDGLPDPSDYNGLFGDEFGEFPDDFFESFYKAGFDGTANMGNGDDLLVLDLNNPFHAGTVGTVEGGDGNDTLWLKHINPGAFQVSQSEEQITLTHKNQVLEISGFEEILLSDESALILA